jgi:hypothetical protein
MATALSFDSGVPESNIGAPALNADAWAFDAEIFFRKSTRRLRNGGPLANKYF